ncbi:uncharacterized protein LOC123212315 [Mangifera indica]|uniref:uncharacterized protein LOC123212315 n=1 Tax=Mangifera indica TaxID=29780 RepID=UPI001CF93CE6|nr:uncharacterized protein LOC123212315 [Mangifera indica]
MAAAVCGSKRSFFEDITASPPISKRLRCGSASPTKLSPPLETLLDQLRAVFPQMDPQLLERVLEECDNDLDFAIKKLNEFCLGTTEEKLDSVEELNASANQGKTAMDENATASDCPSEPNKLPVDGAEWVDLFVTEMMSATNMDDAKARASRLLEILEKSIMTHTADEASRSFLKENMMLKEQIEILIRENAVLKRAVAIQHERQKEYAGKNQELQHLKQLVSQYHEQLRTLEVNNYALTMDLRQAQQCSSIPGRFHPDIF